MTVSRVLNNSGYVDQHTRDRVLAAAHSLNYCFIKTALSRILRGERSRMIATGVANFTKAGAIGEMMFRIDNEAFKNHFLNLSTSLSSDSFMTLNFLKRTWEYQVEGLIMQLWRETQISDAEKGELKKFSNLSLITYFPYETDADIVVVDWAPAICDAIDYLADCGRRRVLLVQDTESFRLHSTFNAHCQKRALRYREAKLGSGDKDERLTGKVERFAELPDAVISVASPWYRAQRIITRRFADADFCYIPVLDVVEAEVLMPDHPFILKPDAHAGRIAARMLFERIQDPALPYRTVKLPMIFMEKFDAVIFERYSRYSNYGYSAQENPEKSKNNIV